MKNESFNFTMHQLFSKNIKKKNKKIDWIINKLSGTDLRLKSFLFPVVSQQTNRKRKRKNKHKLFSYRSDVNIFIYSSLKEVFISKRKWKCFVKIEWNKTTLVFIFVVLYVRLKPMRFPGSVFWVVFFWILILKLFDSNLTLFLNKQFIS